MARAKHAFWKQLLLLLGAGAFAALAWLTLGAAIEWGVLSVLGGTVFGPALTLLFNQTLGLFLPSGALGAAAFPLAIVAIGLVVVNLLGMILLLRELSRRDAISLKHRDVDTLQATRNSFGLFLERLAIQLQESLAILQVIFPLDRGRILFKNTNLGRDKYTTPYGYIVESSLEKSFPFPKKNMEKIDIIYHLNPFRFFYFWMAVLKGWALYGVDVAEWRVRGLENIKASSEGGEITGLNDNHFITCAVKAIIHLIFIPVELPLFLVKELFDLPIEMVRLGWYLVRDRFSYGDTILPGHKKKEKSGPENTSSQTSTEQIRENTGQKKLLALLSQGSVFFKFFDLHYDDETTFEDLENKLFKQWNESYSTEGQVAPQGRFQYRIKSEELFEVDKNAKVSTIAEMEGSFLIYKQPAKKTVAYDIASFTNPLIWNTILPTERSGAKRQTIKVHYKDRVFEIESHTGHNFFGILNSCLRQLSDVEGLFALYINGDSNQPIAGPNLLGNAGIKGQVEFWLRPRAEGNKKLERIEMKVDKVSEMNPSHLSMEYDNNTTLDEVFFVNKVSLSRNNPNMSFDYVYDKNTKSEVPLDVKVVDYLKKHPDPDLNIVWNEVGQEFKKN